MGYVHNGYTHIAGRDTMTIFGIIVLTLIAIALILRAQHGSTTL